jgi:quercetin dioxygenase-like cupin family protein
MDPPQIEKANEMNKHTYLRTHDLTAGHLIIDLADASEELRRQGGASQDRRGVTLVRQSGLSLVLTHLAAGASLAEHAAPGAATVQVLSGRVRARVGDESLNLPAGSLIAFDAGVRHAVEAVDDAILLLTIAEASS